MLRHFVLIIFFLSYLDKADSQVAVTCSCDLTGNSCDANCCCDSDCSSDDVATFQCSTATYNQDSKLCVNELVYVNNLPSTIIQEDNGVFCIINQQDTSLNFYTNYSDVYPNITVSQFNSLLDQYGSYSYDVVSPATTDTAFYQTGDTIDVLYTSTNLTGNFCFPVAGPTGSCINYNPASYMTDQTSSCVQRISDLTTACVANTGSFLDPYTYFDPAIFQIAALPVNTSDTTAAQYVSIATCDGSAPLSISSPTASTCQNVATSITYQITYSGTSGISAACVSFGVGTITSSFLQTFSISFIEVDTIITDVEVRSGNPGYVIGYPLRTGIRDSTSNNITLDTSLLTLLSPGTDDLCSSATANQVKFAEDSRTGCLVSFSSTESCSTLDANIRGVLNIPSGTEVVAVYGNTASSDTSTDSWADVSQLVADSTVGGTTVSSVCTNVVTGINYEVIYANTGSLSNPQAKIISVGYSLVQQSIQFQCFGASCLSSGGDQTLEVTSAITYTDASTSPSSILRVRPTVDARLSADFFYPFSVTSP